MNFVESDEEKDHERVDRLYDVESVAAEVESATVITYRDLSHGRIKIAYCCYATRAIVRGIVKCNLVRYLPEETDTVKQLLCHMSSILAHRRYLCADAYPYDCVNHSGVHKKSHESFGYRTMVVRTSLLGKLSSI